MLTKFVKNLLKMLKIYSNQGINYLSMEEKNYELKN